MCYDYKYASSDLCQALADVTKRLCSEFVDPVSLAPLLGSRLIALDKDPGVRPIGVGDVARRIISKTLLTILKDDILDAAGTQQLCAGETAGCEAAVHSVRSISDNPDCEAILLVHASNAFHSLNRQLALRNISMSCPLFATPVINIYRQLVCGWGSYEIMGRYNSR